MLVNTKVETMKKKLARRNGGLTLVELLVVLGIVAVLIGILVPGLMMVRESARRTSCSNNLRQLGFALQNFESAKNHFPQAVDRLVWRQFRQWPPPDYDWAWASNCASPIVALLAFLELDNQDQQLAYPYTHRFRPPFTASCGVFQCPSDSSMGLNYRTNIGSEPYAYEVLGHAGGNGAFNSWELLRTAEFTDGLSYTVGFCERKIGHGNSVAGEDIWITGHIVDPNHDLIDAETLRELYSGPCEDELQFRYCGHDWPSAGLLHSWYNHVFTPNPNCCDVILDSGVSTNPPLGGSASASSHHRGGVNTCLMDASIQFVSSNIDLEAWISLGTRNDSSPHDPN